MSRITIPKVISAVNTEHPDALDMPDNEFKRLFDECARNRFKITDPEQKWPFWSVERARKKIKAQVQGGIKEKSRKRFFDLLDQYSQNIKSAALMPEVFIRSKSEMEEYWKEISKKQDNQLAEIQKAIKNAELLNHAVSEGQLVVPENMSHPADITEDLHNYLEELSKAIQETRENQNTIRQITIATEEHVRPSAFVYIVALLDSCIADTLRFLFTLNPQQMQAKMNVQTRQENTDRKRLDYKTIIEKGSYQALIAHIVERADDLTSRTLMEC